MGFIDQMPGQLKMKISYPSIFNIYKKNSVFELPNINGFYPQKSPKNSN